MRVLGIDEAGRGCVLGPMVVAGYLVEGTDDAALRDAGARDSKTLAPKRREEVRARLGGLGTADVRRIAAAEIEETSLNALEERVIVDMVARWRPDRVIVDALGPPRALPALIERLRRQLDTPVEWVMEPEADANHPVVGAASIFAKTTRDADIEALKAEWGEFGSGYPHDPQTRRWLSEWFGSGRPWPTFVRTRWSTIGLLAQGALFAAAPAKRATGGKPTKKKAKAARKKVSGKKTGRATRA